MDRRQCIKSIITITPLSLGQEPEEECKLCKKKIVDQDCLAVQRIGKQYFYVHFRCALKMHLRQFPKK